MEYEDEQLAALKKQVRINQEISIKEQGVYIGEEYINFQPVNILDKISIHLPETFIDMPEEIKKMKYPSDNRPEVIKTSLNTNVNFAFNWLDKKNYINQEEDLVLQLKSVLLRTNPSFVFYEESEHKTSGGNTVRTFDFKSYGIDEQMYNMMCIITFHGGTLHGVFNCLDRDSDDWKKIAGQVFQSAEELEKEGIL
ncbi:MAG: hypothetical protein F8N38_06385 [Hungatella sp.]|nr:hypothetical protein [Hungatella sp.]